MNHSGKWHPSARLRLVWFALLPLAGGIGLVAYIVARLSLRLGFVLALAAGIVAAAGVWRQTPVDLRPVIRRRAMVGVIAGIFATAGYDLIRLLLVNVMRFTFWPFDVFTVFGKLLFGTYVPTWVSTAGGLFFHYFNGAGFGVAFVLLFRRPGVSSGLIWAGMLEVFMVSLYPSWLSPKPMSEFLSISILGHVVYGVVLGTLARYGLAKQMGLQTQEISQS